MGQRSRFTPSRRRARRASVTRPATSSKLWQVTSGRRSAHVAAQRPVPAPRSARTPPSGTCDASGRRLVLGGRSEVAAWRWGLRSHQRHDGAQLGVRRPRLPRWAQQVCVLEIVEAQRAERHLLQMRQQARLVDAEHSIQQAVECGACGPAPRKQRPRSAAALAPRRHAARHILQLGRAQPRRSQRVLPLI